MLIGERTGPVVELSLAAALVCACDGVPVYGPGRGVEGRGRQWRADVIEVDVIQTSRSAYCSSVTTLIWACAVARCVKVHHGLVRF